MSRFSEGLHGGPVTRDEIDRVRSALLFEPPNRRRQLTRFWILLTLAAAIATYGLHGDSVATVIGAMIVAPLMLPIMGLAFAVSIGDRKAIATSLVISLGGIATSIAVGYLLSLVANSAFDPTTNSQIMARTAPRLVDLLAAVATGLAGAFATGRQDVSDTLPGVAIAISLVPPLANVGILLSTGHPDLAMGSLLLFVTNYFAILLTGALVFGLMGYPQASLAAKSLRARRVAIVIVVTMIVLISLPLAATTYQVYQSASAEGAVAGAVNTWIEGSGYRYVSTSADGQTVDAVIVGEGPLPPEQDLKDLVGDRVFGMGVHVEALPSQTVDFSTQ
jgi:uncharacterized hydrophobic protein (TIGR00271 family)